MQFVAIDIADSFPVKLLCFSDHTIQLMIQGAFPPIVEDRKEGVSSVFSVNGFALRAEDEEDYQSYYYNFTYQYKTMPTLKAWLAQQQLISPFVKASKQSEEEPDYETQD